MKTRPAFFAKNFRQFIRVILFATLITPSHLASAQQIVVEPDTMNLNASNTITLRNTGDSRLNYVIKTNTSFRTFHSNGLTELNSEPVMPGLNGISAIPNDAGWATSISVYDPYYFPYFLGVGNLNGNNGWVAQGDNWEMVSPQQWEVYMRGRSDGSGVAGSAFSPRVVLGSENVSSFSMNIDFIYSTGSTWQIIPQALTTNQVVTRLQINPDQSLQVLIKDTVGQGSFTRINVPLPNGNFQLSMEVARNSSMFSLFFDGKRVFTGKGFADQVDQVALLSQMEKVNSSIFLTGFYLNGGSSLIGMYNWDIYADLSEASGYLDVGESIIKELSFSESDLIPNVYHDSIEIFSNDMDKPLILLPYSVKVERPYEPALDYTYSPPPPALELSYDTLEATIYKGDTATFNLTIKNKADVEQFVYFPQPENTYDRQDRYNYFIYGPQNFQWTDISTTGTALTLGNDDSQTVKMPFNNKYITIGSNGYLVLDSTRADDPINKPFRQPFSGANLLAAYWDDLAPDEYSGIHYKTYDEKIIIQYTNIPFYGTNLRNTFQAIYYSDGAIEFKYLSMNDRQSATISLGRDYGFDEQSSGFEVLNEPFVKDSLAIFFQPLPSFIVDPDVEPNHYEYVMYPWIHYPEEASLSVGANSNKTIEIKLYNTTHYWAEDLSLGVTRGRIFLHPLPFILPVKITVLENPPPVLGPVNNLTISEKESLEISYTATDQNDSTVLVYMDSIPDFITTVQSGNKSITYKIAPDFGDVGEYALVIHAKDPHGAIDTDTLHLTITPYNAVVDFSLTLFKTGTIVSTFADLVTLDVADPDIEKYTIRANTASEKISSVTFKVDGRFINTDNSKPYTINQWTLPVLSAGYHTFTAQAFSRNNGRGNAFEIKEASIQVINSAAITTFDIVNIYGDKISSLAEGDVINIGDLPFTNVNIVANTSISSVRSVKFSLNGITARIDNRAPYAISGTANGYEIPWNIMPGSYTLTATPYMKYYAWGPAGTPLTVHFSMTNESLSIANARIASENIAVNEKESLGKNADIRKHVIVYPNPVDNEVHVILGDLVDGNFAVKIMGTNGQILYYFKGNATYTPEHFIQLNQLGLTSGVYYLEVTDRNGYRETKKLMKR